MTQPTTTRRDMLRLGTSAAAYAAGAMIVTGGVALASQAKGAASSVSPELERLIAEYRAADDRINRFYQTTYNPAVTRCDAARAAVPHTEIAVQGYRNVLNEDTPPHTYSTANRLDVARCKGIMSIPLDRQSTDPRWQETYRAARRLTIAAKWRERKLARIEKQWDASGVEQREDELWVPIRAARDAIHAFPVASLADLAAKLAFIEQQEGMDGDDLLPLVMADVAHLSGGEA